MRDIHWWLSAFSLVRPWRAFRHDVVMRSPSLSCEASISLHYRSAPVFALKNKTNCKQRSPTQQLHKHNAHYFLCSKMFLLKKAQFLDGPAGRLRRLVLLPDSCHYPVVSLKASAVWRRQICHIWSTVWVKERLKCVFSGGRWAYC